MPSRARRGVSLFEAVAGVTIVGMTAIGALAAVGADFRTAERAQRALEAEALASNRFDQLDLLSDRELQALPDSVENGQFPAPLDEYTWRTTATPDEELPGLYVVTVRVSWSTGNYDLRSAVYRRPPLLTRSVR